MFDRKDKFRVISVGALSWKKGYEQSLMAIRILVDHKVPVHFEIIGDGEDRQMVLFSIHDMELEQHVQLFGRLSPADVQTRLQQSDVFLSTSLEEEGHAELFQAMTCGLPVVTTASVGMSDAIINGVEGFVVPIMDPNSTADALEILWEKAELRLKMGAAAKGKIFKDSALEKQVHQFHELLLERN